MSATTTEYYGDGLKGIAGQAKLTFDFPFIKLMILKLDLMG